MPYRGRVAMLASVLNKPLEAIYSECEGIPPKLPNGQNYTGDVMYHIGTSYTEKYPSGQDLTVEILSNPSHLESINPVVMGRVRAENHIRNTKGRVTDRSKIVPFLIHGDAALSGQGVVYETLQMEKLKNYTVGGTIHVVLSNQIGVT